MAQPSNLLRSTGAVWLLLALAFIQPHGVRAETWQEALGHMSLGTPPQELNRTNCIPLMLKALQSNQVVKALVFMPGATDEFYFHQRARARLTRAEPTLLDAVNALTQQTLIRVTFRPPLLLLHTDEDPLEPLLRVEQSSVAQTLRQTPFLPQINYHDRDWDFLHPILTQTFGMKFLPPGGTSESWHFYRHSLAGWNLTGWEALEAISLAGKTTVTVRRSLILRKPVVLFQGDIRAPQPTHPR